MTLEPACSPSNRISAAILDTFYTDYVWYSNINCRVIFFGVQRAGPFSNIHHKFQEVTPAFFALWRERGI
jgi:hypothetical protein